MCDMNIGIVEQKIDAIVKEYLFNITSLNDHNHFRIREADNACTKYTGFGLLSDKSKNAYVIEEELFLEGCTRVFLINPIIRTLLDMHGIENDWRYGCTFANYSLSNRQYELESFLEFIAVLDGKKIGVRYTTTSYSTKEAVFMDRDTGFLKAKIPGFDSLSPIDGVLVLSWEDVTEEELLQFHPLILGMKSMVSVRSFFNSYLSEEEYELVIKIVKGAIKSAKEIIALNAVPQLLPNNMLNFKQVILDEFDESRLDKLVYEFQKVGISTSMGERDLLIIKESFFHRGYRDALIGNEDFARSFITSEYLFKTVKDGLSIDYTSVVVGYFKSVEQLLYLLYVSSFEGAREMIYWDKCSNKTNNFDITYPDRFRYDPYNLEKGWMQEKYKHKKKTGDKSPEIGELTRFLRYFDKMWAISEAGKEYVFECLEDFRKYYRNSYFHKKNINALQYDEVKRIRNNTHICLYYLLGGFKVLDKSNPIEEQLGVIDYRFEAFYQEIRQKRRRFFEVTFSDGSKDVICYLNNDSDATYNESGILNNTRLKFIKTGISVDEAYIDELNLFLQNEDHIKRNTIYITRKDMPKEIRAIMPNKKYK